MSFNSRQLHKSLPFALSHKRRLQGRHGDGTRLVVGLTPARASLSHSLCSVQDDEAPHGDLQKFLDRGDRPGHETQLFCGQDLGVCEYCRC